MPLSSSIHLILSNFYPLKKLYNRYYTNIFNIFQAVISCDKQHWHPWKNHFNSHPHKEDSGSLRCPKHLALISLISYTHTDNL